LPLLLTQEDLRSLVADSDAIEGAFAAVEEAYREYQRGQTRLVETVGLALTGAQRQLRLCPGVAGAGVSIRTYPVAERDAFPDTSVNALFDPASGRLLALMAGDEINMFRTAAPAGLAARYLAPPESRTLAMLGSGRQAHGFLPTLRRALPTLDQVRVYSPNREHREAYAREMREAVDIVVEAVEQPRQAVEGSDLIAVTSSSRAPVLEADWVRRGACVISIASGQLPPDLVAQARLTVSARDEVVGSEARREPYASMIAAGELSAGRVVEMGEIILGEVPGRVRDDEIVLHEMPGLSFWDAAILGWAYDWAVRNDAGTAFNLSAVDVP
jgi:ornithine cyclodeaminase/alanine dehydrogenase-like protein (mu-crystallin family)